MTWSEKVFKLKKGKVSRDGRHWTTQKMKERVPMMDIKMEATQKSGHLRYYEGCHDKCPKNAIKNATMRQHKGQEISEGNCGVLNFQFGRNHNKP